MATYVVQRKESFTRIAVGKCGVSILTIQELSNEVSNEVFNCFGIFDTVAKLSFYLILSNTPGNL